MWSKNIYLREYILGVGYKTLFGELILEEGVWWWNLKL
jgi:hypothetical protein